MDVSEEDALSVLRKWLDERSPVRFQFDSPPIFKGIFTGIVIELSEREILLGPSGYSGEANPRAVFSISLSTPHYFKFKDPREATTHEDRKELEATMTFMVVIHFVGGGRCLLYELTATE
jgi:hypothetical protein